MGRIVRDLKICGTKKCKVVPTLFDSGCTDNFIRPELADELGIVEIIRRDWVITSMSTEIPKTMEVELLEMDLLGQKVPKPRFLVVDAEYQLTIGAVPMQRYGIELIMVKEKPEIKFLHPRATYASMVVERTREDEAEEKRIEELKEELKKIVRIKAPPTHWNVLYKLIDEEKITGMSRARVDVIEALEDSIEEKLYAIPKGHEKILLSQVPSGLVFKENVPDPFWSSLNIYEDYEKKIKYAIPVVNPKSIAFKEVK